MYQKKECRESKSCRGPSITVFYTTIFYAMMSEQSMISFLFDLWSFQNSKWRERKSFVICDFSLEHCKIVGIGMFKLAEKNDVLPHYGSVNSTRVYKKTYRNKKYIYIAPAY